MTENLTITMETMIPEEEDIEEIQMTLDEYYEKYIKGHTDGELQVGNIFCCNAWDDFMANANLEKNRYTTLDAYLMSDEFIQKCMDLSSLSRDQVIMTINLSRDFSFYSDWHKDEYGFRPRSL